MNQYIFAVRNICDKLVKVVGNADLFKFYWQVYILSRVRAVEPDVYFVSYPKCGRTWARVLLQKYTEQTRGSQQRFDDKSVLSLPDGQIVKFEHGQSNWVPAPLRIEQLSFNTDKYAGKKVALMVRDPRDVLVSSWYHLRYRERIYRHDLSTFIRDDLIGVRKVIAFMNMWVENRSIPAGFHLLTYEQAHADVLSTFRALLEFIGVGVDAHALQRAVEASSFESMKRMESKGTLREPWMKPGAKDLDKSMKVRKGKVGGFQEELSEEDIEFLNSVIREELSPWLSDYR